MGSMIQGIKVTALAGGVGAAKFLRGLIEIVPQEKITIIGNVGDDLELYGLYISPDLDILMYTLADIVDKEKGWGIHNDTFNCLSMLSRYGLERWFMLGDKDLATHIYRTYLLKKGLTLSEVTEKLCKLLGLKVQLIPVTNDHLRTVLVTNEGTLEFQDYFVRRKCKPKVSKVLYIGADKAKPANGVIDAILNADIIIICPSNPILSIAPILSINQVRRTLIKSKAVKVGISPLIKGKAIKGPADKLMKEIGIEASAYGVAKLYQNFLDVFVIDTQDKGLKRDIEKLGIKVLVTNTLMKTLDDKIRLAREVLEFILYKK